MNTNELISRLSKDAPKPPLKKPAFYAVCLTLALLAYGLLSQYFLGIRQDCLEKLTQPLFVSEIVLLLSMTLAALVSAVLLMYPDGYQKKILLNAPFVLLLALCAQLAVNYFIAPSVLATGLAAEPHDIECAISIASISVLPAAAMMCLLNLGACTYPFRAGFYIVLATTGIGCLVLRLSEMNDLVGHLVLWHYCPTLIFCVIGAILARVLLRW